jgi:hypothetical protein
MKDYFEIEGVLHFDPVNRTKKHQSQSEWKKMAMVLFDGDLCKYYSWFIWKRYHLRLALPLRGPHISFINDKESETNGKWEEVKKKWDGKTIKIRLNTDPRTDSANDNSSMHWWLNIPEEHRDQLHSIRAELGLGRPYWGLHMAIGYARNSEDMDKEITGVKTVRMNEEHSKYIHGLIKKGFIRYEDNCRI